MADKLKRDRTARRAEPGDPWPAGENTADSGTLPAEPRDATAPFGERPAGFVAPPQP